MGRIQIEKRVGFQGKYLTLGWPGQWGGGLCGSSKEVKRAGRVACE